MNRVAWAATIVAWLAVGAAAPAWANVITDWDEKAIATTAPLAGVPSPYSPYIWAGFHYRFSTRAGTNMGLHVGEYVVRSVMQPVEASAR